MVSMTTSEHSSDDEKQRLQQEVSELRRKAENQEARIQEYRKLSEQILQGTGAHLAMRVWLKDARQQSEELRILFEQVWSLSQRFRGALQSWILHLMLN
jgi:hypothetical protein